MSGDQRRLGTGREASVMRRRRDVEAPRFRAWSWRVLAATSLVTWGMLGAVQATAASAATAGAGAGHTSHAPHPARHANKLAPAPKKPAAAKTGFSKTTFSTTHKTAANKAGMLSASTALHFATTNVQPITVNTFADDATGTPDNCAPASATPCTLRDAIAAANAASSAIDVQVPPGQYQLVFGTLNLDNANNFGIKVEPTSGGSASSTVISIQENGNDPAGPAGKVSTPVVSLSDATAASTTSDYTIRFTTSVAGALPNGSTITINAPAGTVLPDTGWTVSDATSGTFSPSVSSVALSNSGATATLTLAPASGYDQVPPGQALSVSVTGVTNPAAAPSLNLTVATSADPAAVASAPYTIVAATGQVTAVSASPSPSAAQATGSTYTVHFTPATALSGGNTTADTITITAPAGTDFTSSTASDYSACEGSCTPSDTTFFSSAAPAAVNGSSTDNQVVLTLNSSDPTVSGPATLAAAQSVTLTAAGVTNPPATSAAEVLSVATSQDTTPTLSSAYAITPADNGSILSIGTASNGGLSEINNLSLAGGHTSYGAGVYQDSGTGPVEIDNSHILDGYASSHGAGAYLDGIAYLSNDTFSTNWGYRGGGLYADGSSDVLANNLNFVYNYGYYQGGGADFEGLLTGSGITANYDSTGAPSSYGGGLYLDTYDTQLSGLTANHDTSYEGGGIYEYDYTANLTNVVADNDTATDGYGGGWYEDAYTVTLTSTPGFTNDFSNDRAYDGGGIYIDDYTDILSNVTANNDTVTDDGGGINLDYTISARWTNLSASDDSASSYGGGVYTYEVYGNLTWSNGTVGSPTAPTATATCDLTGSNTAEYGGGIYIEDGNFDGTITLNNLQVDGNTATQGGGLFDDEGYDGGVVINNSDISGNAACNDGDGYGGGIGTYYDASYGAIPTLNNTSVDYNFSDYEGGAVYDYSGGYGTFDVNGGSISFNQAPNDAGGALYLYDGVATLIGVTVDNNTAAYGGGIYNDYGTLTITGGSLSNDTANSTYGGWGGALYDQYDDSEITSITGTVLSNDQGTGSAGNNGAGAIYEGSYDQLSLTNDTLSNNQGDWGGAIYIDSAGVAVHITGSTFSGNNAPGTAASSGGGGAIYNDGWDTSLTNDTLTGNSVTNGSGGAIYNDYTINLNQVTVASNTASTGAGGIDDESQATIGYSILSGDNPAECTGSGLPLGSGGYNVVSDNTCGVQSQGDKTSVNAGVEPLADNGGPTETMALPPSSPAVNVKAAASCPTSTDQRGDARPTPINGVMGCDAGAYQLQDQGYWLAASDGGVFTFGDKAFYGSEGGHHLNAPVVGIAETPSGKGYWLVASDGGVFTFGDAGFYGSEGGQPLNAPVVGIASTPDGLGYYLVASDGGVFTFGDAGFYGSEGGLPLNAPVIGIAPTQSGGGYWLAAADGGVFSFGDATFYGSEGGHHLNAPVVGITSADMGGYWLVASDGGVFSFGDATFFGSEGGHHLNAPVVGMAAPDVSGYWLVASDGGVFTFGDTIFQGSMGGHHLNAPVVGMAGS